MRYGDLQGGVCWLLSALLTANNGLPLYDRRTDYSTRRMSGLRGRHWALALSSAFFFPCSLPAHGDHEALPAKGAAVHGNLLFLSASAQKSLGIELAKVTLADWERTIGANAAVDVPCESHAYASTLVAGRIERILARPGDTVEAGQELARVASMELETLQSALLKTKADLHFATKVLAQKETIAQSGGAPQKDVLTAQANARLATAHFEIAQRKLRSVGLTPAAIDRLLAGEREVTTISITSPMAGEVSAAEVRMGQSVEPLDHLFQIVDRSNVMVVGQVLESDAGLVRIGMPVKISLSGLSGRVFTGRIDHVGLKVDAAQRTVPVRIHMANSDELLRPGMFGRMRIQVERRQECVLCPTEALFEQEGETWALLRQGPGKFVRRRVTVGGRDRLRAEILAGLFPGQRVVTVGRHELAALFAKEIQLGKEAERRSEAAGPAAGAPRHATVVDAPSAAPGGATRPVAYGDSTRSHVVVPGQVEIPTGRKWFATSAVEGRIESLLVERGDHVRAGQVLATIDSLQLRNLEFDLLDAQAKLDLNRQSLERLQGLDRDVAKTPVWRLEAENRTLESSARSIGEKLRLVGLASSEIHQLGQLDLSTGDGGQVAMTLAVRAPADGWVVDFELGLGQVVRPADHLFEIQDLSTVWVRAYVFARDAQRVHLGQKVEVTVTAEPGLVSRGTIDRISPVLDARDRLLAVWTELDNPELKLKEGMLARVAIDVEGAEVAAKDRAKSLSQNRRAGGNPAPQGGFGIGSKRIEE
ncbi:MAG TPA: efflux RND transporter periplasmic adaptor subunit [Pirellulales bacterium]|nr:efflux RND transporter periplasmic adaptor subunit [Pirellulales bacterium]